jgi:hypothetical protein
MVEAVDEQHPVGEPGERVVHGPLADRVLDRLALERVGQDVGRAWRKSMSPAAKPRGAMDCATSTTNGSRERPSIFTDTPAPVRRPP